MSISKLMLIILMGTYLPFSYGQNIHEIPLQAMPPDSVVFVERGEIILEPPDYKKYKLLKDDFYTDSAGNLYEKLFAMCWECDSVDFRAVYVQTMPLRHNLDSMDTLKYFIDILSFQRLGRTYYSKDKNRVYIFLEIVTEDF